ncbi:GspE/PulE family protein [Patescibacteria group bacterium]|nr:GspE/PulE family protein [Patescibacteria group bacterium]
MPIPIDTTLNRMRRQAEEKAASDLAARFGASYVQLDNYPVTLDVLSLVPLDQVEKYQFAAYVRSSDRVRVAVVHIEDEAIRQLIEQYQEKWQREIEYTVVSASSLEYLITTYKELLAEHEAQSQEEASLRREQEQKDYFRKIKTLEDLREEIGKASVTELLDVILAAAYNQNASDVHIEPGEQYLTIRFRIDGVLQKVLELPMAQHHPILSRIKVMAAIKLDEHTHTQDGRFSLENKGINADVRVNTIPTGYGEGVVMRILRQDTTQLSLNELGFTDYNQQIIEKMIHKPYGLILVTGPTGSGKSTTLYALLEALNSPEKKIITLEDPIEYRLNGLQQSQVDTEHGFTFAEGLRGALRQDPDIVMVGEIRDPETATIALNASLTGHLVLSTLHTNNAVTAPTRFLEMGIAPFLLTGSIQMIIAQRLVRKLVPDSPANNPTYHGRIVIAEVLCPNQEFEQAVIQHKDQLTLEQIAVKGGMVPMLQDGLAKVKAGLTTESEIYRVTAV